MTADFKAVKLLNVDKLHKKPIIGILGGIGSGKSTAAAEFVKLGCSVIDADKIAHKLLDTPEIKKNILSIFGNNILDGSGNISRHKLGEIVFNSQDLLKKLTDILHPDVIAEIERQVQYLQGDRTVKAIVLDIPLLLETGLEKRCDRLIFVKCDLKKRVERAAKNSFFDAKQLKIRENLQISLDKKASIAENTIDNNSDLSALARQVADIFPYVFK